MQQTAMIYWSGTGNTQAMAEAIGEGYREVQPEMHTTFVTDTSAEEAAVYETLILGCPAMGAEVLEEEDFEPFFTALESKLAGKKVALFGSYGWGDGEWMREWEQRVRKAGATLIGDEGLILQERPDESGLAACRAFGKTIAEV